MRISLGGIKLPGKSLKRNKSFYIVLVTLDGFYLFGIENRNTDAAFFKNVENRNPILASGFHTDIIAVVCEKPVGKAMRV